MRTDVALGRLIASDPPFRAGNSRQSRTSDFSASLVSEPAVQSAPPQGAPERLGHLPP